MKLESVKKDKEIVETGILEYEQKAAADEAE